MNARTLAAVAVAATATILAVGCDDGGPGRLDGSIDGSSSFVGVMRCAVDSDCDDGLDCTDDACVDREGEGRVCAWTIQSGRCLIDGECWSQGQSRPGETCAMCDAARPRQWSGEGMVCDDGDACTFGAVCTSGFCVGSSVDCDDGIACTADSCDAELGCVNAPVLDGLSCDDGDACTVGDTCGGGACTGERLDCDDGNPCTDDTCDGSGACVHVNNTASCEDGDPCTSGETCGDGVCGGGGPETCDDFNACTVDVCDPIAGCYHLPLLSPCCTGSTSICDDGNPCTTDLCDPTTAACSYENNTAPCSDGNACTVGDVCGGGTCGGSPRDCNDGNDCTRDECNVSVGCFSTPVADGSSCSDGLTCSTGDRCMAGTCQADVSACGCTPTFEDAGKVTSIVIGTGETVGEALDVDGDGTLDNALAPIGSFVNEPIGMAITDGSLMMLFEYQRFAPGPFTLALITGELDPANASCGFQTARCDYWSDRASLRPVTCDRAISLPATRTGTLVTAGSPTTTVPLAIPLDATSVLNLTVYRVNLQMTVTLTGGQVTGFSALLGGAVRETDLNAAIRALDPASLPLPPEELVGLLSTLAPNDIDTNGDGTLDAKSIGLRLTGIDGTLTGALPL